MINEFFEGVSLEEIENFEKTFHIKLPEDYKIFLQTYNGGEYICPGTVLFGIGDKIPDWCSAKIHYETYKGMYPEECLLIGYLNYGGLLLYDHSKGKYLIWDMEKRQCERELKSLFQVILEDVEAI